METLFARLCRGMGVAVIFAAVASLAGCGTGSAVPVGPIAGHAERPAAAITVTTLADAGPGSLRSAIRAVNAQPAGSSSTMSFTIAGTIKLASDLPVIRNNVKIDGTSAPGYAGKAPAVEIDANVHNAVVFAAGSSGSQLLAIAVVNAKRNGVTLQAGSITLNLNYIGLTRGGTALGNRGDGIFVSPASSNNAIGLNPSGASGVVGNVIAGNAGSGLSLHGSSGNTIAANRIGTNPSGDNAVGNGGNGIWLTTGSNGNEIGGTLYVDSKTGQANNPTGSKGTTTPVFVVPPLGNLVSGNGGSGIVIDRDSQNNTLNGNFIGTTAKGDRAIGNAGDGVRIARADNNALVGCKFVNDPFVYYNVAAGNGGNGLRITNSNNVTVQGNFFGIGANNTTPLGNKNDGILIDGASAGAVVGGVIPLGNVSAGNGRNGIEVKDTASGFTTFNTFGGLLAFKGAAPNGNDGLLVTSTGGNQIVRTNVFSGNANNGIEIVGDASGVTIDPNIAGLNTVGNGPLPNGNDGLRIAGTAHGITVGGYTQSVIPQNTFSGNKRFGIEVAGQSHDNQIFNSYAGTDVAGTAAVGNGGAGIYVGGSATKLLVGGNTPDPQKPRKNLVSGNGGNGITLDNGTSYIRVIKNWIGLTRNGRRALPNAGRPIEVKPGSIYDTISGNVTTPF